MSQTKMLTIVFTCILFSSSVASAQVRTVLVSPVPGDPIASGTNLRNALANIPSPSSTNRWLLKIEPGIYQLQGNALAMRPWVDIEGSGIGVTTIRLSSPTIPGVSTISGASNTELRMLTVEATENAIAMFNSSAHPRIYRVKFVVQTNLTQAWAMQNLLSAPTIEECEFIVSINAGSSIATGVSFIDLPAGVRSSILRSRIMVSGATTNYGVHMFRGQTVTEIQETQIDVTGGSSSSAYGIYALGGDWLGSETLELRNVRIKSASSSQSFGILLEANTSVWPDISYSRIEAVSALVTKGIFQGGSPAVVIQNSRISGLTKAVETISASFIIQSSALFGGPTTGGGWNGCLGVWDENGMFYTTGCPQ